MRSADKSILTEFDPTQAQTHELFAIPLLRYVWLQSEDLNEELTRVIMAIRQVDDGIQATNVGGWHSKRNLHEVSEDSVKILLLRIHAMAQEMVKKSVGSTEPAYLSDWVIQAWANISHFGDSVKYHNHNTFSKSQHERLPNYPSTSSFNLWSGVYYVNAGEPDCDGRRGGQIVFADENSIKVVGREEFNKSYSVQPVNGLMLLFPSALGHSVEPFWGSIARITVAFNLRNSFFTTINGEIEKKKNNLP